MDTPGSPLSFRQTLNGQRPLVEMGPPTASKRQPTPSDNGLQQRQMPEAQQHAGGGRPFRETPRRVTPLECTPDAVSAPQTRLAEGSFSRRSQQPQGRGGGSPALRSDPADRLAQVEQILERLLQEAQLLRDENRKVRAAKEDLRSLDSRHLLLDGDSEVGADSPARLKSEVARLRRKLHEQDEELRNLRCQAAFINAACEPPNTKSLPPFEDQEVAEEEEAQLPEDAEGLRALLVSKQGALARSHREVRSLRSELALLRSSEAIKAAELEELRTCCSQLRVELIERRRELSSCAREAVSLGAQAAAAKGAQASQALELNEMQRAHQQQLREQVERRLSLDATKQEAQMEIERLRAAYRAVEERADCHAELLRDRDEEVRLLQQRLERLCRQREADALKLKDQRAALLRWRAYILFLEKLIRDLRVFIVSQAAASSAGSVRLQSFGVYSQQQKKKPSTDTHLDWPHGTTAPQGAAGPLAATGYNLLPLHLSKHGPSAHRAPSEWLLPANSSGRLSSLPQLADGRRAMSLAAASPRPEDSESVEQLEKLMQEAADKLRATAAAARRGGGTLGSGRPRGSRSPCRRRPAAGEGPSSPGSTEASSICGSAAASAAAYMGCGRGEGVGEGLAGSEWGEESLLHAGDLGGPPAYVVVGARPPVRGAESSRPLEDELGSLADPGSCSFSDLSAGAPVGSLSSRKLGSCSKWLNKGAAAAHLAREIASRFPAAFERLQKTAPALRLPPKR
ncbi:hypothetical protein Efla_001992 [Eimeria flavescens]